MAPPHEWINTLKVTLYSKTVCNQCTITARLLRERNVEFTTINVEHDAEALERVTALGYKQAPVVVIDGPFGDIEHWSGLNPGKVNEHFGPKPKG